MKMKRKDKNDYHQHYFIIFSTKIYKLSIMSHHSMKILQIRFESTFSYKLYIIWVFRVGQRRDKSGQKVPIFANLSHIKGKSKQILFRMPPNFRSRGKILLNYCCWPTKSRSLDCASTNCWVITRRSHWSSTSASWETSEGCTPETVSLRRNKT